MSAPELHTETVRGAAYVMAQKRVARGHLRGVAFWAFTLLLLGCEIERTTQTAEQAGAPTDQDSKPAPAPTSLSEALSPSAKKKVRQEEPALPPIAPAGVQEVPSEPQPEPPPTGRPLSELQEWARDAKWWGGGAEDESHRLLFVYGGGAAVKILHLPESTPAGALDAVVAIVEQLELSPSTNAGRGAARRLDGSVEVDALLRQADGKVGGVFGAAKIQNPIRLAAALARAGGAQVRGSAAERLAAKLELDFLPLETAESQEKYVEDLARYLAKPHAEDNRALFHLFVDPQLASSALMRKQELPEAPPRDPIVVVFSTEEGEPIVAASHGGLPLSLPGSESLLQGERAIAWDGQRVALLLPRYACSYSASQLLTPWNQLPPLLRRVEKDCPGVRYSVIEDAKIETNLPADTFAQALLPRVEDSPARSAQEAPSSAELPAPGNSSKVGTESKVKTPSAGPDTPSAGSASPRPKGLAPVVSGQAPSKSPTESEGADPRGVQQ